MTDDLIKRADEALKDVTPGPWETVFDRQTWGWLEIDGLSFRIGAPTRATDLSLADEVQRKKDARFIAAARELVPAMRDRIKADAKRIAELEAALRWYHDQMCEGFCEDLRHDITYTPEMDDVCAGCKARAALGEKNDG